MTRDMIHWHHSSEHSMVVMMIPAGLSVTMSTLLVSGRMGPSMATSSSLFVDTSGWAYLVDRVAPIHRDVQMVYQEALTRQRLLVTTNYIIAELVALLTSRSRISRQQILMFIDALKATPQIKVIHIDTDFDAAAWTLLKARMDKEW